MIEFEKFVFVINLIKLSVKLWLKFNHTQLFPFSTTVYKWIIDITGQLTILESTYVNTKLLYPLSKSQGPFLVFLVLNWFFHWLNLNFCFPFFFWFLIIAKRKTPNLFLNLVPFSNRTVIEIDWIVKDYLFLIKVSVEFSTISNL